ncbi:hypothetical protein [Polymorphospora rubra]|uniref:hypothetical protein n=1 Tax=Polymorphospora rubra TaxID=338584 RepID=UPI0033D23E80
MASAGLRFCGIAENAPRPAAAGSATSPTSVRDMPVEGHLAQRAGDEAQHRPEVAFLAAGRAQRVGEQLVSAERVSDAIYGAGFNSNGHFYASTWDILGMMPTLFRAGSARGSIR